MIEVRRFVQAFEQALAQTIMQRQNQLGKGQCANHEEYKGKVGEIKGMEASAGLARDMLRQMEMAEDAAIDQQEPKKRGAGGKK